MQCKESAVSLGLEILSKIGLRDKIIGTIAFSPPQLSYTIRLVKNIEDEQTLSILNNASDMIPHQNDTPDNLQTFSLDVMQQLLRENEGGFTSSYLRVSVNDTDYEIKSFCKKSKGQSQKTPSLDRRESELEQPLNSQLNIIPKGWTKKTLACRIRSQQPRNKLISREFRRPNRLKTNLIQEVVNINRCATQYNIKTQKQKRPQYYQPSSQKYQTYQLMLINCEGKAFEISPTENLTLSSYLLKTRNHTLIASTFVDYVLLFSHGNSTDLGYMIDTYLGIFQRKFSDLAMNFNINVFAYEYSGYGQSTGKCNDINSIHDIQAAYDFLVNQLGFHPTKIILYGYSIGAGPSTILGFVTQLHRWRSYPSFRIYQWFSCGKHQHEENSLS